MTHFQPILFSQDISAFMKPSATQLRKLIFRNANDQLGKNGFRVTYIPIIPRIADFVAETFVAEEVSCDRLFDYKDIMGSDFDLIRDFYDGPTFKSIHDRYGEENIKNDIFVAISTDGFCTLENEQ